MSDLDKSTGIGMYGKWKNTLNIAFSGKSVKERMLLATNAAFSCALAFFFTARQLPCTTLALGAPLTDALLCSASAHTPFVYIGAIFGSIHYGLASIPRFLALTFTFVLRIVTSISNTKAKPEKAPFEEKISVKSAVCTAHCFAECGMYLATSGINGESARKTLATLIAVPLITLILSIYYSKPASNKVRRALYEASMLFLFACAVYCTSDITYAFFTLDTLLCVFFTLCIAKFGGFARSALYGFVLGYLVGQQYCIAFVLMGASASLLFSAGAFSGCGISCAVACVCSVMTGGANALLGIVPEIVLACAVTTPVIRYAFLPKGFPYPANDATYTSTFSDNMRSALAELSFINSLKNASENMRELKSAVNEASRPLNEQNGTSCALDKICSEFCESCPLCTICHDSEKERCRSAINELILLCNEPDALSAERLPPYLSSHCIKLRELTEYTKSISNSLPSIAPVTEITPRISYSSVSDIIASVYEKAESELVFDASAERSVAKLLYSLGIPFGGASVMGKGSKRILIYGASKPKLKKSFLQINKGLNSIFGCDYSLTEAYSSEQAPIVLSPCEALCAESEILLSCKKGESVCGDTAITFKNGGCFYALITDGMGSGSTACKSSTITAEIIKSLMLSEIDETLAIKLAGETLAPICDECFSTVDLMKLDLSNGNATITKNHAAASYILRNGSVYCCNAHSLPVGITGEASPERIELRLLEGDTVIMVSDGVAAEPNDKPRLADIIGVSASLTGRELAQRIMSRAEETNGKNDDMSVLVVKISKAA